MKYTQNNNENMKYNKTINNIYSLNNNITILYKYELYMAVLIILFYE